MVTRKIKVTARTSVVTTIIHCRLEHNSFSSLCIKENHGTVLEWLFKGYCRVMNKRRALQSCNSKQDSQQLKVTIMVILIAILYVLLSIPKLMLQTLFFMDNQYNFDGAYMQTFFFLTFTGDLFARINSANDFFIYVLVSSLKL